MKFLRKNTGILKYTEYKKKQALYLQIKIDENESTGKTDEMICILKYIDYLRIVNASFDFKLVMFYFDSILDYDWQNPGQKPQSYVPEIAENINSLMDNIL